MLHELLTGFIYTTGFLSLLMAAGQFIVKERNAGRYIQALFLFCAGICQIYNAMFISGFLFCYPHLILVNIPFLYSLGPLVYFYFKYLMHKSVEIRIKYFIHFIPATMLVVALFPFYIQNESFKRDYIAFPPGLFFESGYSVLHLILMGFIFSMIVFYCILFFRHNNYIFNKKQVEVRRIVYFSHYIVIAVLLVVLIYIGGTVFSVVNSHIGDFYKNLITLLSMLTGTIFIVIYFMDKRYPDYYNQLQKEIDHIQYQQSRIEGLDIDDVIERLTSLMEEEKIYRVEDLSLGNCARELDIAPYQLSQILNEKMSNNFCSYINAYRINEARDIIACDPNRSISTIGFEVGFNSTSAFYNWFYKLTGTAPGKYREKIINR